MAQRGHTPLGSLVVLGRKPRDFSLEGISRLSTTPLWSWTYLGLMIAALVFPYGGFMVGRMMMYGNLVSGYASVILIIMLFIGGIELIGIGVVNECLGRIDADADRPDGLH